MNSAVDIKQVLADFDELLALQHHIFSPTFSYFYIYLSMWGAAGARIGQKYQK